MNIAFLAFVKIAKLLYPFIKESILGQDSVLTILRKRKVFVFVVVSNLALFLTTAFLAEQNFIFLDRLKSLKAEKVIALESNAKLTVTNQKLLRLLNGDADEICYQHLFGSGEDNVENSNNTETNHIQHSGDRQSGSDGVEQQSIYEE